MIPYRSDFLVDTGHEAVVLGNAADSLAGQADAIRRASKLLGREFCQAVDLLQRCAGHVVVLGMGKSGLIGRKIASTFACSGTPSIFVHPADAAHGDLGMLTAKDVLVLISHSGSTEELLRLLPYFAELKVPTLAIVGRLDSPLARSADVVLCTHVESEACPHNLVVTTSALVTLALADAITLELMSRKQTSSSEVGHRHPGGALGRRTPSATFSRPLRK